VLDGLKFIEIQTGFFGEGILLENHPVIVGLSLSNCSVKLEVIVHNKYVCWRINY
jgi:hypothetical protein